MTWTSAQVAEKIGSSNGFIKRLITEGLLTPVNEPKPGKLKFFAKFDPTQVNTLIRSGVLRKSGGRTYINEPFADPVEPPVALEPTTRRVSVTPALIADPKPAPGILSRLATLEARIDAMQGDTAEMLARVEAKLDQLLAVWA